jgi:hypothetical protein
VHPCVNDKGVVRGEGAMIDVDAEIAKQTAVACSRSQYP